MLRRTAPGRTAPGTGGTEPNEPADEVTVSIRRMGLQDLPDVVAAHRQHFPNGFFARLGPRFLRRYYRTFLDGPLAVALIVEVSGVPSGYLVGVLDPVQHRRLLLTYHGVALAACGLFGLMRRPTVLTRFVLTRARRYLTALRRSRDRVIESVDGPRIAVLSNVVVAEHARGLGLGTLLVDAFLAQARDVGRDRACLVTVAGPDGAGSFYTKSGWQHTRDATGADGQRLSHFERDLSEMV